MDLLAQLANWKVRWVGSLETGENAGQQKGGRETIRNQVYSSVEAFWPLGRSA